MKAKSNGSVVAYKKDHSGFMIFDFYGQYVKRLMIFFVGLAILSLGITSANAQQGLVETVANG